jgi:hypothetical protein
MIQRFLKGKSILLIVVLLPFSFSGLYGQEIKLHQLYPINPEPNLTQTNAATGTLQIVAVMVEFQPDDNRFTSGNGTFEDDAIPYLQDPGTHVDALPHNHDYFEARLEFVSNYYEQVSGGLLTIEYQLLPDIIRLDHQMEHYSPIGEDPTFEPLAEMSEEVWEKVAATGNFDPAGLNPDETAYVIFHAGIGRDIELTGTILDKTPQDIPSIYLSKNALGRLLGDTAFDGFSSGTENFRIKNSIISPRTLSRSGTDIGGERFVLPLSANGMLTAQIGSHLGLPDLFNTEDGQSGIGAFGLMDGAGIFAFNGLFPPEPSAWEKIHLGWETSFPVSVHSDSPADLPAASLRQPDPIARINLSSDEYFLVENRHRDPMGEGVTITIRKSDGNTVQQTFTNLDTGFRPENRDFDQFLEPGVIIDVSNFDWALPGGYDEGAGRHLNGGILIWHIDESVIRRTIQDNRVNANPGHRGVELKEADGAQDIGRPAQIGITDNNPNGWAFDFWWDGNNASVTTQTGTISLYENRFGPDTTPANNSHSGAPAFFELYNFTPTLPIASFSIQSVSDSRLEISEKRHLTLEGTFRTPRDNSLLDLYPYGLNLAQFDNSQFLIVPGLTNVTALQLDEDDTTVHTFPDGSYRHPFLSGLLILADAVPSDANTLYGWQWNPSENQFEERWSRTVDPFPGFMSSADGNIIDLDHSTQLVSVIDGLPPGDKQEPTQSTAEIDGRTGQITGTSVSFRSFTDEQMFSSPLPEADSGRRSYLSLVRTAAGRFDLLIIGNDRIYLQETAGQQERKLLVERTGLDWPALVDINRDGYLDVVYTDPGTGILEAVNLNGAVLDNFPIIPPRDVRFSGTPLVADLNGDGNLEVIVAGFDESSMNIYAFNRRGVALDPFPLLVGGLDSADGRLVNPVLSGESLFAVSPSGDLREWSLPLMQHPLWSSKYGEHPWNKVTGAVEADREPDLTFGLLNRDKTYNWPNPATDETQLHFQVSEPAEVNIRIATMSGRQIYNRTVHTSGGATDTIPIDTSTWSSGGYFAVVTARAGNREERKIVKIGIVR